MPTPNPNPLDPNNNGLLPNAAPTVPDYSVATKVNEITSKASPLMQQAKTAGMKFANKRGLLNSSIAAEASQDAVIKNALPIASQDSQQEYGKHIAGMNLAANDRDKATAAAVSYGQIYSQMFESFAGNENIPKETRDKYLTHIALLNDSNMNLIEQLYGINLEWASPQVA